jgi:hypothetical protein
VRGGVWRGMAGVVEAKTEQARLLAHCTRLKIATAFSGGLMDSWSVGGGRTTRAGPRLLCHLMEFTARKIRGCGG